MATADPRRGKVLRGKTLPYGTLTMSEEDSVIRSAYYNYGYRSDEDMPPLPCIEPDDEVVDPEEEMWKKERQQELGKLLDGLNPRLAKILRLRFGFGMARDMSLEEVGNVFGISRERVRQLEAKALRLLKHPNRKLRAIINPEAFAQQEFMDKERLRKRMYDIEMIHQGWKWMQRQLNNGIIPVKHEGVEFWIEHIEKTDPQLYWHFHHEVTKHIDGIFAHRLRSPHDNGRAQAQGRA
jgi:hypothetical protein